MRAVVIMGLFSFLVSCQDKPDGVAKPVDSITVDLAAFQVNNTKLGAAPAEVDFFAQPLKASEVFEDSPNGIEVGTQDGVLDYVFLTLSNFGGDFLLDGAPVEITRDSTEASIVEKFGEPYWIDRSDGELVMFYEYDAGAVELQFEWPDPASLGYVTLSRNGVLSSEEQRRDYGVDKPWPPK